MTTAQQPSFKQRLFAGPVLDRIATTGLITAGLLYETPLPAVNMERYMQVEYNVATAPFSAGGNVSSWLAPRGSGGSWYGYNKNAGEVNSF